MSPDPTREAAFDLLHAVLIRRHSLEDALGRLEPADPRDRAAAHRLAASVLRHAGSLAAVLEPHLRRAPPDEAMLVLRIGAAGLLFLDTPPHAAVATAVALARSRGLVPFAGMVNAVLRRVAGQSAAGGAAGGAAALAGLDLPRLDTPSWLWSSWGPQARAIATAHAREAGIDLTVKPGFVPEGAVALPTGSWRLPAGTRVAALPGFEAGEFWVQDAAAALPARLLAARGGEAVADLCAAPGGKTAQLAMTGARVVAVDRDAARLERLAANLSRLRLPATPVRADATAWGGAGSFDAILLDAPCSATGTIRRHPDVPHLKRPRDLAALAATQDALLGAAARLLRPGGRLVYAVCSLQPEEGAARLAAARRAGLVDDPVRADEMADLPDALQADGTVRTTPALWPDRGGLDGFFVARLRRP